jgi:hypothetical protein
MPEESARPEPNICGECYADLTREANHGKNCVWYEPDIDEEEGVLTDAETKESHERRP